MSLIVTEKNKKGDIVKALFYVRFLGPCPTCQAEDSLCNSSLTQPDLICCQSCRNEWSYKPRMEEEKKWEQGLKRVAISNDRVGVKVDDPWVDGIPYARTIATIINQGVVLRFRLDACLAVEGGVEGAWKGYPVEYRNWGEEWLGLFNEYYWLPPNPVWVQIQAWYTDVLRLLFTEELRFGGRSYGIGSILRLDPSVSGSEADAKLLVWLALAKKARNKKFATRVFQALGEDTVAQRFLAGLTDEDITQLFVPPPAYGDEEGGKRWL